MPTTLTTDQLRALRETFGTLTITARRSSDTYIARAAGVRRRSASCTASAEDAARRLACGIFGVADHHLDLCHVASGVFQICIADPDGLTPSEAKALNYLAEAGGTLDIVSPDLARTLWFLSHRRSDLVELANAPADLSGTRPYHRATITAAGRAALQPKKGGA